MTNLQIEYFLNVATTKSISKTAADLYVSAPAVSKQIALVEQELGFTLFARGVRGMELTPEGQVMFDYFINLKGSFDRAVQQAKNLNFRHRNSLHLSIMAGWAIHPQIMELQKRLRCASVPTELIPHAVFDPGNPHRLEKGIFDAALCLGDDLFTTALTTDVHMTQLTKIKKIFLFSSQLPIAQKDDPSPADLAGLSLLSFSSDIRPHAKFDNLRLCGRFGFTPELILKESLDDVFLNAAIGTGFMIGDEWLTEKNLPEFSFLPIDETHSIYLVWSEQNPNPALHILERLCENEIDWTVP